MVYVCKSLWVFLRRVTFYGSIQVISITGGVRDLGVEPRYSVGVATEEFFRDLQQLRSVYFYDSTKWFIQFGGDYSGGSLTWRNLE